MQSERDPEPRLLADLVRQMEEAQRDHAELRADLDELRAEAAELNDRLTAPSWLLLEDDFAAIAEDDELLDALAAGQIPDPRDPMSARLAAWLDECADTDPGAVWDGPQRDPARAARRDRAAAHPRGRAGGDLLGRR